MLTKFFIAFCVLALMAAFAGTVPAVAHVTFYKSVVVSGTTIPAGEYRLMISDSKVTFTFNKKSFDVAVKIDAAPKKFDNTEVMYGGGTDQEVVRQINIGGTKTTLIFK
jgi:hypothetical protein